MSATHPDVMTGVAQRFTVQQGGVAAIPLSRIVRVELRKSFDTRAGFWLLASIGIASLLTTAAIIVFAPAEQLTYSSFTLAISYPMAVILPLVALLSVTAEWSQRGGLTTFALVPRRGRIVAAKATAAVIVGLVSMVLAFVIGALGHVVGAAISGTATNWDQGLAALVYFGLANTLFVTVGFTLGVLIRSSVGAIVAYVIYTFVVPTLLVLLATYKPWFRDIQPWVDPNYTQDALFQGAFVAEQWAQLGVTTLAWVFVPLAIGVFTLLRSEVK